MRDPRLDKLAAVIVDYSTNVQPGQYVLLKGEPIGMPLFEALYERIIKKGAYVRFDCQPDSFRQTLLTHGNEDQLAHLPDLLMQEVEMMDVSIGLWAETNTKSLTGIDPSRQGKASAARRPYMKIFMERAAKGELKWCGTLFPTSASAQDAEMSLSEYEDFVFRAGYLHLDDPVAKWKEIEVCQQKVADYLNDGKKEVRFQTANGTDLTVNVEGMQWINCAGRENFPDGEVFTGPNLNAACGGVNGIVRYSFPAVHKGREVDGVELVFERGRVVRAKASKNEDYLIKMLDQDEGARSVGEIAIGTNYCIQRCTRNTLFDENAASHIALGQCYSKCFKGELDLSKEEITKRAFYPPILI